MRHPDLHIVCFAVPFPATYGGAIDVWNKIVALAAEGVKIHLHCFVYASFKPQPILKQHAVQVHYYPRVLWPALFSKGLPFIVSSRKSPALLNALKGDQRPILFEGIHTTGFATILEGRRIFLRSHNIEHQYYAELAKHNYGPKSLIYKRESQCLEPYEKMMAKVCQVVFSISPEDDQWFSNHGATSVNLPPFHGCNRIDILNGRGSYLLYHGDLSIEINQQAVLDLLKRLPLEPGYPIVIAGRAGEVAFEQKLSHHPNLKREADVSQEKMIQLIQGAQIILIHSLHGSGMKLKIFPALFHGRFVAATTNCKTNTVLDKAMHLYEPAEVDRIIKQLWQAEFSNPELSERTDILSQHPGDKAKALEIIRYL